MVDFFISYAGKNEDWAQWIAWSLDEAGYSTILQKWDFKPGANFVLCMDKAAKEAARTIAVLSPAYLDSDFARAECAAAFGTDPGGKKRSLIPVRVETCEWAGLLKPVIYIDLVGFDEDAARHSLLEGITDGRNKPGTAPNFPGIQSSLLPQPSFPGPPAMQSTFPSFLGILRLCPSPVPAAVLADTAQTTTEALKSDLKRLVDQRTVIEKEGFVSLASEKIGEIAEPSADQLNRAVDSFLRFYARYKHEATGRSQLRNIVSVARASVEAKNSVPRVFSVIEKGLKFLGEKALVLEVAQLSIQSCQHQPRGKQEVKLEAQALVCGLSWVYQRQGQLEDALAAAEKSLHLGRQVDDDFNTAYCSKCQGRLYRIMAKADKAKRGEFIEKSLQQLDVAIKQFGALAGFGPDSAEVGDCYSLQGRTLLFANRRLAAGESIRNASQRITDPNTKDYPDMMILMGDLEAARGNHELALENYGTAIGLGRAEDAERSEILARAFLARGRSNAQLKKTKAAREDFQKAKEIWQSLREPDGIAECRWEEILLDDPPSQHDLAYLMDHPLRARVIAYERHGNRLMALPAGARRAKAPKTYWEQLLHEAEQQVAIEGNGC